MSENDNPSIIYSNPIKEHSFIVCSDTLPLISEVNKLSAYIINMLLKTDYSVSKLKKLGKINIQWRDNKSNIHESEITLESLSENIRSTRSIDSELINIPPIKCDWLDEFVGIAKPDAPIVSSDGKQFAKFALPLSYGEKFPLQPCIDREGIIYRSLQYPLKENIIRLYYKLINDSYIATKFNGVWLNDLRMMLNDCISIVDVTLHQLYYKAKYQNELMGWKFDANDIGPSLNIRLKDKIKWIGKITGRSLDDAQKELSSFNKLKEVRNHLNHFDPPCFAYTLEDAVNWMNLVPDIGKLLWKIRDKMNVQLSKKLIEVILLPRVEFIPKDPYAPRIPQDMEVGYMSSRWPQKKQEPPFY
jgi:hypothetical protein